MLFQHLITMIHICLRFFSRFLQAWIRSRGRCCCTGRELWSIPELASKLLLNKYFAGFHRRFRFCPSLPHCLGCISRALSISSSRTSVLRGTLLYISRDLVLIIGGD